MFIFIEKKKHTHPERREFISIKVNSELYQYNKEDQKQKKI